MKRLLLVSLLLLTFGLVVLGCAAEAQSDAAAVEDAITGIFVAYNEADYDGCLGYLNGITAENRETIKAGLAMAHGFTGDITINSVENVTVNGSTATATVTATMQGQTQTTTMTLNKVGNKWMMDGEEAFGQS
ncbi:MAG: hypothetical protein FJ020_06955 [Chloroflexi bacterium]|nr:hypothetical protein [Chloroflexota bacterium]